MQYVSTIVGGQYGSEAKGHVTAQLVKAAAKDARDFATEHDVPIPETINVRVAGPNAGHTVYDDQGQKFALRQIPVGAVYEDVKLYIAPGSEIDLDVLYSEIEALEAAGHPIQHRLWISRQATVITQEHKDAEAALVGDIGSTGKGIGAARAARLLRSAQTIGDYMEDAGLGTMWEWREPSEWYASDDFVHDNLSHVLIEGTQGYGLSLRASGFYPYVTSSDARAIDFMAMAGVDPTRCSVKATNWVVARVFPIRVAGNSGPMLGETSWDELGLPEERTTVTQKVRRVGEFDADLLREAVQANGGHNAQVVITMLDQVIPGLADVDPDQIHDDEGTVDPSQSEYLQEALAWVNENAGYDKIGAHVGAITFGPTKMLFTDHGANANNPEGSGQAMVDAIMGQLFGGGQ
ncbi:PurA-like adenylosuccinate synthetase [Microbacterium phage Rasovi]|nr:PurA-like adenylosuccinate synthetase [Microbacterium phage Rasovi]